MLKRKLDYKGLKVHRLNSNSRLVCLFICFFTKVRYALPGYMPCSHCGLLRLRGLCPQFERLGLPLPLDVLFIDWDGHRAEETGAVMVCVFVPNGHDTEVTVWCTLLHAEYSLQVDAHNAESKFTSASLARKLLAIRQQADWRSIQLIRLRVPGQLQQQWRENCI